MRLIALILLFIQINLSSQEQPFYKSQLYFEDSIGNKDTLIVGYDPEVVSRELSEQFGEKDISNIPFDSTFEVRGAHFNEFNSYTGPLVHSKTIIGYTTAYSNAWECYPINEPIVILVNIKNLPLKVSWIPNDFKSSECVVQSRITNHLYPLVTEFWMDDSIALENTVCLAEEEHVIYQNFYGNDYRIEDIEGLGKDTISLLLLQFRYQGAPFNPCSFTVSTIEFEGKLKHHKIFPNPSSGRVKSTFESGTEYEIFNLQSILVDKGSLYSKEINLSHLSKGLYLIRFFENGNWVPFKLIIN